MNGPVRGQCRRLFLLAAPLAFAAIAVPAAPGGAAEEARLTPGEVAERLQTIQTIAGDVAAAGAHKEKATLIVEAIEPIWAGIEHTIKANDKASYEALEAAIESLEEAATAGEATKAGGAAGALASAVNFYVAKFPAGAGGDRKAAAPTPAPADGNTIPVSATPSERQAAAESPAGGNTVPVSATPPEGQAAAESPAAGAAAEAGDATLARTGPMSAALAVLGGAAFALGGLAVMAGARRRPSSLM